MGRRAVDTNAGGARTHTENDVGIESTRIALVGGGRMATAMIRGLIRERGGPDGIVVGEPDAGRRQALSAELGIRCEADNRLATADADVVVLAVKPQVAARACAGLPLPPGCTVISVMAGVPVAVMQEWFGDAVRCVRAMPNTPALIGRGVTGVWMPPALDEAARAQVRAILETLGELVEVDSEARLDAVTAISGSGPAYFFAFTEALRDAGRELGLDAAQADRLARGTFTGAAALLQASGEDPAELRAQVTSPGGATAAALAAFAEAGLQDVVRAAVRAALQRTEELGAIARAH